MKQDRLTQRQNEAYEFIRDYMDRHRKPPTLQEIGDALDISSSNGVFKLLTALEEKGWIEREKHAARGIHLVKENESLFGTEGGLPSLPVISRTPSDQPERLRERPKGTLSVDDRLLRDATDPTACVVGQVGDDGMNGAGIRKGDLLLIEEMDWTNLDNGVMVGALIRDQLLPREFYFANGRLHLRPADRHYTEESFSAGHPDYYVIGRVLTLVRTL